MNSLCRATLAQQFIKPALKINHFRELECAWVDWNNDQPNWSMVAEHISVDPSVKRSTKNWRQPQPTGGCHSCRLSDPGQPDAQLLELQDLALLGNNMGVLLQQASDN